MKEYDFKEYGEAQKRTIHTPCFYYLLKQDKRWNVAYMTEISEEEEKRYDYSLEASVKEDSDKITEEDFKSNNYLLIQTNFNPCSEESLKLDNYDIDDNSIKVLFTYKDKCGLCAPEYIYTLIKVDKKLTNPKVEIDYKATNKPNCPKDVAYKPMIYLYPNKEMNISLNITGNGMLMLIHLVN